MSLNAKQQAFVDEYLVDLNATAASVRAGYSHGDYGRQLLTKPHVAAAIEKAMEARSQRTEITADRVMQELGRIAFADIRRLFEWDEERAAFVPSRDLSDDDAAAISSIKAKTTRDENGNTHIELELKTHSKLGAIREIGKHLGIAERLELTGKNGGPVECVEVSDQELLERLRSRVAAAKAG